MEYPIYEPARSSKLKSSDLNQGDILDAEKLRPNLRGHQDYFAEQSHFYRFMILTQSCDLARGGVDFIFVAVVRRLSETIGRRETDAPGKTRKLFEDLYNHNNHKRGFFYLPKNVESGIEEDSVVDLRVMFTLFNKEHYSDLVASRIGTLTDHYVAKLGYMAGYLFNRVATPSWAELNSELYRAEPKERGRKTVDPFSLHLDGVLRDFTEKEERRFQQLLNETDGNCALSGCENKASTYRWIPVSDQGDLKYETHIFCDNHARKWDDRELGDNARLK